MARLGPRAFGLHADSQGCARIWQPAGNRPVLLLGNAANAAAALDGNLEAAPSAVSHVVCVASSKNAQLLSKRSSGSSTQFCRYPMSDALSAGQVVNIQELLAEPLATLADAMAPGDGGRAAVLVHCDMGVNRSPTLVLAFLVSQGLSLREAYTHVLRARPGIDPLPGV